MKRLGGGYWRLEMRLGLMLGYGNAFGVESGPECWGGEGYPPPPFQAIPCAGPCVVARGGPAARARGRALKGPPLSVHAHE